VIAIVRPDWSVDAPPVVIFAFSTEDAPEAAAFEGSAVDSVIREMVKRERHVFCTLFITLLIPSFVLVAAIAVGDERYAIFAFILLCGDTTKDDTFCCMELRYNSATALGMILMNLMMN